jgi:IS5 family transposase
MKVEVVIERTGVPVGVVTAGADTAEVDLAEPALATIPSGVSIGRDVPVVADRGYDSDPLRDRLRADGYRLLAPHRRNRTRPDRNDGRRMRRYRRRYLVERTNAWLHCYRRVIVRYEWWSYLYHGFVHLACAFIALGRL